MTVDYDKHEEILFFLEENISKLVRQKVASRAKYKEYDENYMNYLTADSIDDEIRKEMYGGLVEECYRFLRKKLNKALDENPELKNDEIVSEYIALMK